LKEFERSYIFEKLNNASDEIRNKEVILRPSSLTNWIRCPAEFIFGVYFKEESSKLFEKAGAKAFQGTLFHYYVEQYLKCERVSKIVDVYKKIDLNNFDLGDVNIAEVNDNVFYSFEAIKDQIENYKNFMELEFKFDKMKISDNIFLEGSADILTDHSIIDVKTVSTWFTNADNEKNSLYQKHMCQLQAYALLYENQFGKLPTEFEIFKVKIHSKKPEAMSFKYPCVLSKRGVGIKTLLEEIITSIDLWKKKNIDASILFHYNDYKLF
jgi:hypothetical protein